MDILRLPSQDISGVRLRRLNSPWLHLLWLKSCCSMCPLGWGSVCAQHLEQGWNLLSGLYPRVGPALAADNKRFARCPHHWSPPRTAPGPQQEPALSAAWTVALSPVGTSPPRNTEDKTLLSQSTSLLAEFCSSVIKTRGTPFWLRNRGRRAAPSEWVPFAWLAPDQAP